MNRMLNKIEITLTKEQYNGLLFLHKIAGKILQQASPNDETPFVVTGPEFLQIIGEELISGFTNKPE